MNAQQMQYAMLVSTLPLGTCCQNFFFSKKNSIGCSQPKMIVITCRIMIAAISFLLGYENAPQEDDSDASSSEDEADQNPQILLSKQDVYKVL
jgi:uncharacterized membrane protein YwzB